MSTVLMTKRALAALALTSLLVVSCGDDDEAAPSTAAPPATTAAPTSAVPSTEAPATTTAVPTTAAVTTTPATTAPATTATTSPGTTVPFAPQPAMWPAADVVFATPEEAAADFVSQVLRVPPELGEFMAGDQRSGEIEVFSPGEGGPGSRVVRALLFLRMLGPADGWFVIGAASEGVTIASPEYGDTVPVGMLDVFGRGRGFEATLIVEVFPQGSAVPLVGPVLASGGALETAEPYTAALDLSAATPGSTVLLLVRAGTGLETDPGEFSALPLVIG